jgi:hypothetical protein
MCVAIATAADQADAAEPVRVLDVTQLFNASPTDKAQRRSHHDTLVALACLQGLANRTAPRFYLVYSEQTVPLGPAGSPIRIDRLWLERMQDANEGAGVLAGRAIVPLVGFSAAVDSYGSHASGLAVWDENVPATLNGAFAAAAAEGLVVARWDASPDSVLAQLSKKGLQPKVWLVNQDGSSLFVAGKAGSLIPGTTRPSSQSAKADVYLWVLEKYLKTGLLDPTEFGYMVDGQWIGDPLDHNANKPAPTNVLALVNHDWQVARRGLPFDLSPWPGAQPTDDPGQPPGTDRAVVRELMQTARSLAGQAPIVVRGFYPWPFKYSVATGLPNSPPYDNPVKGENESTKMISAYAAGLDADPWSPTPYMTNASFFAHVPLDQTPEPQPRLTPEDMVGAGYLEGLAPNGGFEDDTEGWVVKLTSHQVYADPTVARTGLRFLECFTTAVYDNEKDNLFRDGPGVAPGATVTLRAFVRGNAKSVKGEVVIWADGGAQEKAAADFEATPGAWKEARVRLDVKNPGHVRTRGQLYLRTADALLDIDDVAFYAGNSAEGAVEPAAYASWFVGDYDAAAQMYSKTPELWDGPGRGRVPLAWDFSGRVASRMPLFVRHALRTRTPRDFFVGANSGPGYANPSEMDAPARGIWVAAGVRAARVLDTSIGWVLNPLDPVDADHMRAVTPFFSDGIYFQTEGQNVVASAGGILDNVPIQFLHNVAAGPAAAIQSDAEYHLPATSPAASFHAFRSAFPAVADLVQATSALSQPGSGRRVRFVDPYTFFALKRHHLGGHNTHRASYLDVKVPQSTGIGEPVSVTLSVRNDGWETWVRAGADPFRLGAQVSSTPPAWNEVHKKPGSYPHRFDLPQDVPPGGSVPMTVSLPPFTQSGTWTLQVDMVRENHTWFEHADMAGDIPMQVTLHVVDGDAGAEAGAPADGGADARDGAVAADSAGGPDSAAAPDSKGNADGERSGSIESPVGEGDSGCGCRVGGRVPRRVPASALGIAGLVAALAGLRRSLRHRRAVALSVRSLLERPGSR